MRTTDLPLIRRSRLFAQVGEIDLAAMLTTCFVQTLPAGAALCHQGEKAEFLHIVLSGRVGLFGSAGHDEALVEFFGPGDAFIVPAVVLDAPYLLTARILEEGRILMWPAAAFRAQLRATGSLAFGAVLLLSGYWRTLIGQIKDLKLLSAIERLSAFLLALAPRETGPVTVTLPGGRRLVAGRLGITPQSLSRAFAALRPLGISGGGRQVTIVDPGRLREFAGARALKGPDGGA
ncbi:cyclic nucleotide-binding domain-containing protein [Reyranella sp.]|jgi:CRP/FNR family transcriptional activator FtrB|uniref:cyclic nucleotide-binding domain-containing protein n=1 Tax=Reyranella sp. TaxID=1929291 RepID=UPI003C7CE20F